MDGQMSPLASQSSVERTSLPSDIIIYAVLAESYVKKLKRTMEETVRRITELEKYGINVENVSISGDYCEDLDRLLSLLGPGAVEDFSPIVMHKLGFDTCTYVITQYHSDQNYKEQIDKLSKILDIKL
jgi:hypothetical protein